MKFDELLKLDMEELTPSMPYPESERFTQLKKDIWNDAVEIITRTIEYETQTYQGHRSYDSIKLIKMIRDLKR